MRNSILSTEFTVSTAEDCSLKLIQCRKKRQYSHCLKAGKYKRFPLSGIFQLSDILAEHSGIILQLCIGTNWGEYIIVSQSSEQKGRDAGFIRHNKIIYSTGGFFSIGRESLSENVKLLNSKPFVWMHPF